MKMKTLSMTILFIMPSSLAHKQKRLGVMELVEQIKEVLMMNLFLRSVIKLRSLQIKEDNRTKYNILRLIP